MKRNITRWTVVPRTHAMLDRSSWESSRFVIQRLWIPGIRSRSPIPTDRAIHAMSWLCCDVHVGEEAMFAQLEEKSKSSTEESTWADSSSEAEAGEFKQARAGEKKVGHTHSIYCYMIVERLNRIT